MAFVDPLKPIIARMFATDVPPNKRIEIGPGSSPTVNEIRFYSGQGAETNYGYIDVQGTANSTTMDMAPPKLGATTPAIPLFFMKAQNIAPQSQIYHEAVRQDFFVTGALGNFPNLRIAATGANGDAQLTLNDGANDATWKAAVFNSSWVNFAAPGTEDTRYRKFPTGMVLLDGAFKDSLATGVNPIFTLDVGFRPGQLQEYPIKSNNDAASISWLQIATNGNVNVVGNVAQARVRAALSGIQFFAEN